MHARSSLELIPGAGRLMSSLRDMGYEFSTAVADLVDNSIEAGATQVSVDIEFEGENSWVRIADNGCGMTPAQLREAMRYGSSRKYSTDDLGKFGLGLKVASLSQCRKLSVASSRGDRAETAAYCWDLGHIQKTNRWELVALTRDSASASLYHPLKGTPGTVVLWQRLDRILSYEYPNGESARRRLSTMAREVEGHLAMVFHRYLAGEVRGRPKLRVAVNGADVSPWDPFARDELATRTLAPITIPIAHGGVKGQVKLEPYVLPHQADFSSAESFRRASGPANWNQQQGFYIYRADRLIQCGGWSRIRTLDEHTKLARIALRFSPQLDEAFRVNVAKMRVHLPSSLRDPITQAIFPVTKVANDVYRRTSQRLASGGVTLHRALDHEHAAEKAHKLAANDAMRRSIDSLLRVADRAEKAVIRRVASRLKST
jgi:anti-sigma regulatory factor (Ser/Thr protein kinase)